MLKNMKLGKKLIIYFLIVTVISTIASIVAVVFMIRNNSISEYTLKYYGFAQGDIGELGIRFQKERSFIQDVIILSDYEKMKEIEKEFIQIRVDIQASLQKVNSIVVTPEGENFFNELNGLIGEYQKISEQVFQLGLENKPKEAYTIFSEKGRPIAKQVETCIDDFSELNVKLGAEATIDMNKTSFTAILITIIITSIATIISILIAIKISKEISTPMKLMASVAEEISNGNLDVEINYSSGNEIGFLANSLKKSISTIKIYITELSHILDNISKGNLIVETTDDYKGNFIQMKTSLNNIIYSLNNTFISINESAEQVSNGSKQMADGAIVLAEGSTDQASSIEELSATIDEISEKISNNASNSLEVSKISEDSAIEIKQGNQQMQNVVNAMGEINKSTGEISKIIKTVESIASQTNLLALNASIEAARAGEAGKSFVVVANKVRDLASKSSEAAKNTNILIENVINNVNNGTKIVYETADSLTKISDKAEHIQQLITQISQASGEQAFSISQITQGVEQIANVVQNNSATSEESAAASQELSSQALTLKVLINKFKLKRQ